MLYLSPINPVAVSLGPIHIHWYGLLYLVAFAQAYILARVRASSRWQPEDIDDLIYYGALGVILGGRIGYLLFYQTMTFLHAPWTVFYIWEGGMSFHGGLIGVLLAMFCLAKRHKRSFLDITDFVAPLVPLGLAAGRLGNFINAELWGRPTDVPWAMVFPTADDLPRHPSQLYELGLEGIALFILVWCYSRVPRPPGCVSAVFLIGYSVSRILVECVREPDEQLGLLLGHGVTMGQLLSVPMLIIGLLLWWTRRCKLTSPS